MEKILEPLNQTKFAEHLGVSDRTLMRYRDQIESEWGVSTTVVGGKKQVFYQPEWFEVYQALKLGLPLEPESFTCEIPKVVESQESEPFQDTSVACNADEPIPAEIVIHDGNHRDVVDLNIPKSFDLGALRSDESVLAVSDPLALAEQALAAMDLVSNAMKLDLRDQKAKLRATQTAADQIDARASELRLEKLQYEVESRVTAELQNPATAKLQKGLGVLGNGEKTPDGSNDSAGRSQ